ncbi:universal stress protein [Runella sp. SP2]|uniref:universal stress protein n=1 Tax=Runella sp. SP2 TaxID=2268026 RepID=UPI000F09393F|nr:universal stress protein [Runella sp. SP2]AYQ33651.1 universal stress protein [Runella sp. SP2]
MERTILVPIDFKVESLNALRLALNTINAGKVNVVLMYAKIPTDSISDFLFYSPDEMVDTLKTTEFEEAIAIIKNRYESLLGSISIELFHGYSANALSNFLEARNIEKIYFSKNYKLKPGKKGFDPTPLLKKSRVSYQEVGGESVVAERKTLSTLFNYFGLEIANH